MAQWIPKTAWRMNNLNRTYGVAELGLHTTAPGLRAGVPRPPPFFAAPYRPVRAVLSATGSSAAAASEMDAARAALKRAYDAQVPFIDLRDEYDVAQKPVQRALVLHPHDLLSGACNEILPQDKANALIVVFAASEQRAVNGLRALRRWGYENVVVTSDAVVADFDVQPT